MNTKSHIGFWLAIFLALFLLNPLIRSGDSMRVFVSRELAMTESVFGGGSADWMKARASKVFAAFTPADKLTDAVVVGEGMSRTERVVSGPGAAVTRAYNGYVGRLVLNVFIVILRFFNFALWFLLLFPVFLASVVDGMMQRSIKRSEFGAIRPAAYAVTSATVIPLLFAPLVYLTVPMPVTPLVAPIWALLIILPLSAMVSNMQPIFGRN